MAKIFIVGNSVQNPTLQWQTQTGSLNRLLQEHRKTAAGDTIYKIEYTFDDNSSKNGNIHRVVYDGKHVTEFTYNEMNELTGITHPDSSTETLTYDNNGNLTQTVNNTTGETTAYEWDCFNRLTKVTMPPKYGAEAGEEINFTYNGDDELIKIAYPDMTIDMKESKGDFVRKTAKFRFNGQKTPSDVEMSSFDIYIMSQLLCKYSSGPDAASTSRNSGRNTGEARFYHYDHNGNMALVTDEYGNVTNKILTDAYGNVLPLENSNNSGKNKDGKTLSETLMSGISGILYLHKLRIYLWNLIIKPTMRKYLFHQQSSNFTNQYLSDYYQDKAFKMDSRQQVNSKNPDVFGSNNLNQQWIIMQLMDRGVINCPKMGNTINSLPWWRSAKERQLLFVIKDLGDFNEMMSDTTKFDLPPSIPIKYLITYSIYLSSRFWDEISREINFPFYSTVLMHEFVHVKDNINMSREKYWGDFFEDQTYAIYCKHPSGGEKVMAVQALTEYHAYYVAWKILEGIEHPKAKDAKIRYEYFKEIIFDKCCKISDHYKVDVKLSDYC